MSEYAESIREAAERDLEVFIRLVSPKAVLGSIHIELIKWMNREGRKTHQLILMPRDHQKSRLIAFRVVQAITCDPTLRVLYISATSDLAEKQLKFMKDILTSPLYRKYWPNHVILEEARREKWTSSEISLDHPARKIEGVRDPTVFTAGLTTTITGLHCDIAVLDDVVVDENAVTSDGRAKVESQYSLLSSIEGTDSQEWVVGTRYHPKDLYGQLIQLEVETTNDEGVVLDSQPIYEVFQKEVEDSSQGDGTGHFLWPRQQRVDGKWFGFSKEILAQKKAKYLSASKFRAQYYNNPNDVTDSPIARTLFQYYDPKYIKRDNGRWFFKDRALNVFAAIDFAYSKSKKADYTALCVVGMDTYKNIYVLDVERIKSDKVSDYFELILRKHVKWNFRKLRAETNAAQATIVSTLKYDYLRERGVMISIDEKSSTRHEGTKEERIQNILEPYYTDGKVWHFMGGECQNLEEELVLQRPPHDDIKDALSSCISICSPPMARTVREIIQKQEGNIYHPRFGGVAH